MDTVAVAKFLMKRFETIPVPPDIKVSTLNEVFRHPVFLNGSESTRGEIMLNSSQAKYNDECAYPFDNYFGTSLRPLLQGKHVLDLGCFTGGRSAAWFERYSLGRLDGIDIAPEYIGAAARFAQRKGINAHFRLAMGEELPFDDQVFDAILSFDVLEHVTSVKKTLDECYRVLKPGGRLFVVFPSYFQPIEHHLSLVTRTPCIHYFFGGQTLLRAYCEILSERGSAADWYRRSSAHLEPWEKCNIINGMTLARFRVLLKENDWKVVLHSKKPIGSIGRRSSNKIVKLASLVFRPLASVPYVQEVFLHRITFILERAAK